MSALLRLGRAHGIIGGLRMPTPDTDQKVPNHIAFIMDGNRRWAKKQGFPTLLGHRKGFNRIEAVVKYAQKRGVRFVTFWAFSTENWKRDQKEVEYLMRLFRTMFKSKWMQDLDRDGVKIQIIGDISAFPKDIQQSTADIVERTKNNTSITATIGFNYGGREEIIRAVNTLLAKKVPAITQEEFGSYLYTKDMPDPDLIIRSGGEQRLSGFLPWQSTYAELYFPEIFWPDFTPTEFAKALDEYSSRQRRFGK